MSNSRNIGADPGAQGDVGKSPLGEAAATNNRKIAELLLSYQGSLTLLDPISIPTFNCIDL